MNQTGRQGLPSPGLQAVLPRSAGLEHRQLAQLNRRRVLLVSQGLMAATVFLLWGTWAVGWRDPVLILAITALTGVFGGLMIPSWQAFVPSLVPKSDLPSAITLNSTQFNASRALGPALAVCCWPPPAPAWPSSSTVGRSWL